MSSTIAQLSRSVSFLERRAREKPNSFSLEEIKKITEACTKIGWEDGVGRCNNLLGLYHSSVGNKSEAQRQFLSAIEIGAKLNNLNLLTESLYDLALSYFETSNLTDAYTNIKEAESYARQTNNNYYLAACNYIEACIKSRYGEHDSAIIMLQSAQHIAKTHAPELMGTILQNIVEIHLINGEFREAREYALSYLNLHSSNGHVQNRLNALIRLATIEVELSQIQNAQKLLEEAQQLITSKNSIIYATMLCLLASIAIKKKNYETGLQYSQKAAMLYRKFQKPRLESNAMAIAGQAFLASKDAPSAIKFASKALKLAKEAEDRYMTKESLQLLHKAHKASKDMERSLKYLEEYNELARQDAVKQFENRLAFVNLKTEYEKKQSEVEEARRKAEKLQEELEAKERDLTERTRNLIKQTESLAKLRDDLRAIIKNAPGNVIAKQVSERLRSLPDSQSNWVEFEKHFTSVHPDFELKLLEHFPSLTKMERKICILLRLNLMSVDMAKLLILSERNIENHRHRLRKKLGIGPDTNLQEFLSNLA